MVTTGNLGTERISSRMVVHHALRRHFSIDELEDVVFETWGTSAEDLNLTYDTKNNFIMRIILYSLETSSQERLLNVLRKHRDFVEWVDFD